MRLSKHLPAISAWIILLVGFGVVPQMLGSNGALADDDDPDYQHVWVHYDYMVAPDHNHAPDPAAIQLVVDAYKKHGIKLHIDPHHSAIPETHIVHFEPTSPTTAEGRTR